MLGGNSHPGPLWSHSRPGACAGSATLCPDRPSRSPHAPGTAVPSSGWRPWCLPGDARLALGPSHACPQSHQERAIQGRVALPTWRTWSCTNCWFFPGPDQGASQLSAGHRRVHDGGGQHSGQGLPRFQGKVSGRPALPVPPRLWGLRFCPGDGAELARWDLLGCESQGEVLEGRGCAPANPCPCKPRELPTLPTITAWRGDLPPQQGLDGRRPPPAPSTSVPRGVGGPRAFSPARCTSCVPAPWASRTWESLPLKL